MRQLSRFLSLAIATTIAAACGGGDPTTPAETPAITLTASSATASTAQGANTVVVLTIARTGGFTGPVELSAEGTPSGVTASFVPATIPTGSTASVVTLTAVAQATVGSATVTIRARSAGVTERSATIQLTVTAAIPSTFTLAATPPSAGIAAGQFGQGSITLTRQGAFAANVTLTIEGAPSGLTATGTVDGAGGNPATGSLLISVAGSVPAGSYPVTVRGSSSGGLTASAPLTITVIAAPPGTATTWRFCTTDLQPSVFAFRDGTTGAWSRSVATNGVYSFNLAQSVGSVALVWLYNNGDSEIDIYQFATSEAQNEAATGTCGPTATGRTVFGSVAGVATGENASVAFGTVLASITGPGSQFTLTNTASGPLDLIAARFSTGTGAAPTRFIVRRGLSPAAGSTITPTLDFAGTESFAPASALYTFGSDAEDFQARVTFASGDRSTLMPLSLGTVTGAVGSRTVVGVPLDKLGTDDTHVIEGTTFNQAAARYIGVVNRSIEPRTVTFGPMFTAPTLTTTAGGGLSRPRARGPWQPEYGGRVFFEIDQFIGSLDRYVFLQSTKAFYGTAPDYDLAVPDLSLIPGWNSAWDLRSGSQATVAVTGAGYTMGAKGDLRSDGAMTRAAQRVSGVIP